VSGAVGHQNPAEPIIEPVPQPVGDLWPGGWVTELGEQHSDPVGIGRHRIADGNSHPVTGPHRRGPSWPIAGTGYLGYLGTRRDRQGQGLGTQMLREVLAGLDTDGVPAYLESSSERNLPLYDRNGSRVVGELQALGHGPTIWRMWHEPQPRT